MASELGQDGLARTAAARRAELAQTYLPSSAVQSTLSVDAITLAAWRKERRLLAVWHEPAKQWLYPDFQFDHEGLIEQMPRLLSVFDHYYSHIWNNTWSIVEWFMSPHLLLDGARPMEVMAKNPKQVLRIAQVEFLQDPATLW